MASLLLLCYQLFAALPEVYINEKRTQVIIRVDHEVTHKVQMFILNS